MVGKTVVINYFGSIFVAALLFIPQLVCGQDTLPKSEKDGWAIHIGAGHVYGGNIGILGERQILLKEKIRISPFAACGIAEGETDSIGNRNNWLGVTAGANMEFGKKHRVIFGPQFVMQQSLGASGVVKKNQLVCGSFIVGYKGTADFGLIWQVYIGDIYMQDPTVDSKKYSHSSHVGLGVGYKF